MGSKNAPKQPGRRAQTPPATPPLRPSSGAKVDVPTELEATRQALRDALDQQTALAETLQTVSRSRFELQPVLDAVIEHAVQLSHGEWGFLDRLDGANQQRVAVSSRAPKDDDRALVGVQTEISHWNFGRAILERRPISFRSEDVAKEPDAPTRTRTWLERHPNLRIGLGVPLMAAAGPIGVLGLWGSNDRIFSEREITLVESFAAQAVIAIENVRLFNETKEALERQTATGEVLKVISRSAFDLQRVLDTVIESATKLTHGSSGTIWRLEGEQYRVAASSFSVPDETMKETFRRLAIRPHEQDTALTRAALSRLPVQVEDVQTDPGYRSAMSRDISPRTLLAVPLLREGVPIGVLVIGRRQVNPFTEKEIELAANFADQAVIAIENTRLLNEIQDQSRQLEAASRHKSEFLANMSHELRTPLNAIIGFSDVLEQRMFGPLNDQQAEYVRDIAGSGRHLLDLVNEILDLAKIEAGRMELELSEFALADTIRGALAFVRERAAGHRIELGAQLPEDLGTLVADERKIRQVLLNLLSNAVKFTPDGGRVALRAQRRDSEIQVSVRDSGIGIALEDQPKVFEEFRQVGKTTERSREGTGLGLTLAKRFIELHGGRIWIESEVDKGTTFTFAIPAGRVAPASA